MQKYWRKCSYCKTILGCGDDNSKKDCLDCNLNDCPKTDVTSHSACEPCFLKAKKEIDEYLKSTKGG